MCQHSYAFLYQNNFICSFIICQTSETTVYTERLFEPSHMFNGTFRPPLTHSSNAHAQPSNGARCLIFGRTIRLLPYFMCANSEGSGETARILTTAMSVAMVNLIFHHSYSSHACEEFAQMGHTCCKEFVRTRVTNTKWEKYGPIKHHKLPSYLHV